MTPSEILATAQAELDQANIKELRSPPPSRFISNLEFMKKLWDIEIDFNREEGNQKTELWHKHFNEINQCWNLRYASPQVSGPENQERHAELLKALSELCSPKKQILSYRPTSHRKFLGKIIVYLKNLFFHLLQPYLQELLELLQTEQSRSIQFQVISSELHHETLQNILFKRQTDFNAEIVRLLNEITKYVLFVRQKRFNQEATNFISALPSHIDEIYQSLNLRIQILEEQKDGAENTDSQKQKESQIILKLETLLSSLKNIIQEKQQIPAIEETLQTIQDHRYHQFEDIFRGSREEIMRRQRRYLGYFLGCRKVVDLGCGRGEFLELCNHHGVEVLGVDINSEMVRTCQERNLKAVESELLKFLEAQPDSSLDGIFSAQVIEHLEKNILFELLRLAFLKLKPGSYLIFETLNVDNLIVGASRFYADITHIRPIPSSTLEFLAKSFGFQETFILYSSPIPDEAKLAMLPVEASAPGSERWTNEILNNNFEKLNQILFTYQDYALVARHPEQN